MFIANLVTDFSQTCQPFIPNPVNIVKSTQIQRKVGTLKSPCHSEHCRVNDINTANPALSVGYERHGMAGEWVSLYWSRQSVVAR